MKIKSCISLCCFLFFQLLIYDLSAQDWEVVRMEDFSTAYPNFSNTLDFHHSNCSPSTFGASGQAMDICATSYTNNFYLGFSIELSSQYEYRIKWSFKTNTHPGNYPKKVQFFLGSTPGEFSTPISDTLTVPYFPQTSAIAPIHEGNIFQAQDGTSFLSISPVGNINTPGAQIRFDDFILEKRLAPPPEPILADEDGWETIIFENFNEINSGDELPDFLQADETSHGLPYGVSGYSNDLCLETNAHDPILSISANLSSDYEYKISWNAARAYTFEASYAQFYLVEGTNYLNFTEEDAISTVLEILPFKPEPDSGLSWEDLLLESNVFQGIDGSAKLVLATINWPDGPYNPTKWFDNVTLKRRPIERSDWDYSLNPLIEPLDGQCDGSLTIYIQENNGPYTFEWSTGQNTQSINNLCTGLYEVTITDGNGCGHILNANLSGGECNLSCDMINLVIPESQVGDTVQMNIHINDTIPYLITTNAVGDTEYQEYTGNETSFFFINPLAQSITFNSCITVQSLTNENCKITKCFTIRAPHYYLISDQWCGGNLGLQSSDNQSISSIIINEVNIGEHTDNFVELLVVGNSDCEDVDLRNYIIDDNNGDFSKRSYGTGVSPGHLRFPNTKNWNNIPVGSLLVIYDEEKNQKLSFDEDLTDNNKDGVYFIPSFYLQGNTSSPNFSLPKKYKKDLNDKNGKWDLIWFFEEGDAVQVRYPDGEYCHGLGFGNQSLISGGPDDLLFSNVIQGEKLIYFNSGDFKKKSSYSEVKNTSQRVSPGAPNSDANARFINELCNSDQPTNNNKYLDVLVYPNPFNRTFQIEFEQNQKKELQIKLYDFLGREFYSNKQVFDKGFHSIPIELGSNASPGIYLIGIMENGKRIFEQKVICTK